MSSRVATTDGTDNRLVPDVIGSKADAAATVVGTTKSIVAILKGLFNGQAQGDRFWVKKTLTSSAIVAAGVDVTLASSGGDLAIEDVIVKTDGTGLAAATNFVLETTNVKGLAAFFSTAVSGLGANKTVDLNGASVTKIKTILESTKKIVAKPTVADATGAGTIDVWILFRRVAAGATVAAA